MTRASVNNQFVEQTEWSPSFSLCPNKITASDIDGICERNGKFLVMESKAPNELVSVGQAILLSRLSKLPDFDVFVVYMPSKSLGIVSEFYYVNNGICGQTHKGHDKWCQVVERWWNKVN